MNRPLRIAVVGGGIAGLGAAWLLARRHEVVLYEAAGRIGGHAHTVDVAAGGHASPVDTGFIVYNEKNYPNLTALFRTLAVPTRASEMSFAVSAGGGALEYSGTDLGGLFAQRRNLVRPRFLGMLRDIARFYREAPALLAPGVPQLTLGRYLAAGGYGRTFVDDHLLPMAAAVWSCPARTMLDFPAVAFVRFCDNHGLLRVAGRPEWRTVVGGSREYVRRLLAGFAGRVRLATPVSRVERATGSVRVHAGDGDADRFDAVVLATHADQSLAMLADATAAERRVLGAFRYARNRTILHGDPALMPRLRRVWSSWNYLADGPPGDRAVSVTYWMNRLQGIDPALPLFVSLNPLREPDPRLVHGSWDYHHPIFDTDAMAAQGRLADLQGTRGVWFCGSWCGYGFHEDALTSAVAVADALGAAPPWRPAAPAVADAA